MKKVSVILLFIFCAHASHAQRMLIYKTDSTVFTYDVSQIATMHFTHDTTGWATSFLRVFYDSSMQEYSIENIDSLKVAYDSTYGESLFVFYHYYPNKNYWFLFGTTGSDIYSLNHIDSLTFAPAPQPPPIVNDSINGNVVSPNVEYFNNTFRDSELAAPTCAVWTGNRIYCSAWPLLSIDINDSLEIIKDSEISVFEPLTMSIDSSGKRLLFGPSSSSGFPIGRLFEYQLSTGNLEVLDSGGNNSCGVYVPGTENIIYYTYGSYSDTNTNPADAGYYLFDRATGQKTFLLHHFSDLGPGEVVNGFDISPDGKKLLIPSVDYYRMPRIVEYDLTTHASDTLRVPFNTSYCRWLLWLRYSHDGTKILYSNYPYGPSNDSSEVGIIDRVTLQKQVLYVNPVTTFPWVCVYPEWSPDDTQIVYTAGILDYEPAGYVGIGSLCFLRTLR